MNKKGKNIQDDQVSHAMAKKEQQNINIETTAKMEPHNSYIVQTKEDLSNEHITQTKEDLSNEDITQTKEDLSNEHITQTKEDLSNEHITQTKEDLSNEHITQTKEDLSNEHITQTKEDLSNERISQLETKLAISQRELRDLQLRTQAKIENINRRVEIDMEKAHKFALEKLINELLPVIDSLERALEVTDKTNIELSSMIEGIELILKSFLNVVRKFGVEVISDINVPFNPEVHQAMSMVESEDIAPNHVLIVMQRGYTLNGRLLRPAMVAVTKAKN